MSDDTRPPEESMEPASSQDLAPAASDAALAQAEAPPAADAEAAAAEKATGNGPEPTASAVESSTEQPAEPAGDQPAEPAAAQSAQAGGITAVDTGRRVELAAGRSAKGGPPGRHRRRERPAAEGGARLGAGAETPVARTPPPGKAGPRPDESARPRRPAPQVTRPVERAVDEALLAKRERRTTFDTSGDFAALLAEAGSFGRQELRIGDKIDATVADIGKESVFFELGLGRDGWMPIGELVDGQGELALRVGDRVRAFVVSTSDGVQLSRRISGGVDLELLEEAKASGIPVQGKVSAVNTGGLEVELGGGARGFCPIGQADIAFVEDSKSFVGKTLSFLVREIREGGRNVVLSRKLLLERERAEQAAKLLESLEVGQMREGIITRIQPFGAFVDLGGLDGMIPVSELSWGHVKNPADVVQEGQSVRVEVRKIEPDPKRPERPRIGLSLRAAQQDPWDTHAGALGVGQTLAGRVTRVETFGAFVELFEGVEGLVHVSELAHERVRLPADVVSVGDQVAARILEVDWDRRRLSLSLREARELSPTTSTAAVATPAPARGKAVQGVVERIERYGVFVKLDTGATALLPASESGTPRGTDLARVFPLGTELALLVIDVDERGRVKVSKVAREQADERAELAAYSQSQTASSSAGFGTFADLLRAKLGGG